MKKSILITLSLVIIIFLNITIINNYSFHNTTVSDEDVLYLSAENILIYDSLKLNIDSNKNLDTCLISSYLTSMDSNKNVFFNVMPTSAIFYSFFMSILHKNSFFYLPMFFSSLTLIFIFLICRRLCKSSLPALLVTLVCLFFPSFLKVNLGFYDIIPTLTFLLISIYVLLIEKESFKLYFLSSLFFILAISIRLSEIVYIIPFCIFIFLKCKNVKKTLFWVMVIFFFTLTIFLFNMHFFGNLFFISKTQVTFYPCYNLPSEITGSITETLRYFYIGENKFEVMGKHIIFFWEFLFKFWFLGIISILGIFTIIKNRDSKFFIFIMSTFLMMIIFYGHLSSYYGFMEYNLQNSFLRYSLLSFILLFILLGHFLKSFFTSLKSKQKYLIILIIIIMLFSSIITTYNFKKNGIYEYNNVRDNLYKNRGYIQNLLDKDSFIITTAFSDKMVSNNFKNTICIEKYYSNNQVPQSVLLADLSNLIYKLYKEDFPVYFITDTYNDPRLTQSFLEERYILKEIGRTKEIIIFQLITKNRAS